MGKNQANLIEVDLCALVTEETWLKITPNNCGTTQVPLYTYVHTYQKSKTDDQVKMGNNI